MAHHVAHSDDAKHRVDESRPLRAPRPRPRWLAPVLAGAAVLVVIGGASAVVAQRSGDEGPKAGELGGASGSPAGGESGSPSGAPGPDADLAGLSLRFANPCPLVDKAQAAVLVGGPIVKTEQVEPGDVTEGGFPSSIYSCSLYTPGSITKGKNGSTSWSVGRPRAIRVYVLPPRPPEDLIGASVPGSSCSERDSSALPEPQVAYTCLVDNSHGLQSGSVGVGGTYGQATVVCQLDLPAEEIAGKSDLTDAYCLDLVAAMPRA